MRQLELTSQRCSGYYDMPMGVGETIETWPRETYGTHLMLRLGGIERAQALDSPAGIHRYLRDLVDGIGMRILDGPYTKTEDVESSRYGHSGIVLLVESHAAIHTYPRLLTLFLDVFSCKSFDVSSVIAITQQRFGTFEVIESAVLDRGHHWPEDAGYALQTWHDAS
jgi:S-adenosylmethionine decarboxylase